MTPKFDADGLITCVATDARSGDVLMVAHMNAEALAKTIATGEAGTSAARAARCGGRARRSGHTQRVVEMRVDCDQDAVWIKVEQVAAAPATPGAAPASTARCRSARAARSTLEFRGSASLIRKVYRDHS